MYSSGLDGLTEVGEVEFELEDAIADESGDGEGGGFFLSLVVIAWERERTCEEEEDRNAEKASFLSRRRERW